MKIGSTLLGAFIHLAFFVPLFPTAMMPTASVYATAGLEAEGGVPPNLIFAGAMIILALAGYFIAQGGQAASE